MVPFILPQASGGSSSSLLGGVAPAAVGPYGPLTPGQKKPCPHPCPLQTCSMLLRHVFGLVEHTTPEGVP